MDDIKAIVKDKYGKAALLYYNRFSEEIRREIDANAALTPEALERRYPGLVQTVRAG